MYLEAEIYHLLAIGFALVISIAATILLVLFCRTRNRNILWFVAQLLFLVASFLWFYRALCNTPNMNYSMYTEDETFFVVNSAICWGLSMIFSTLGVYNICK